MLYKSPRLNNLALKANTFGTQDKILTIFICCLITRMQRQPIGFWHGLRTLREDIAFTARPKIQCQSQSIFCLPQRPIFSDFFDLCLHWVSVVCVPIYGAGGHGPPRARKHFFVQKIAGTVDLTNFDLNGLGTSI